MSDTSDRLWPLPSRWQWSTAGEIADIVGGGTPSSNVSTNFEGGTIPWLTPADLSGYKGKYISHGSRSLTHAGLNNSAARMLPAGTLLFTSRAPIGYVAIAANPMATNQGFKSMFFPSGIQPEFAYYYLMWAKPLALSLASGTTFPEISTTQTAKLPFAVAPYEEQTRVVGALDSYLSRLDEAVACTTRAQRNLRRYRAAVLKAAVEGRLVPTEAELARAEKRNYEPASELLERILAERRRRWEEGELAKLSANGKKPRGEEWRLGYEEPATPENATRLPDLPAGWCWSTVGQLIAKGPVNGLYVPRTRYGKGMPILRIDDYQFAWSRASAQLQKVDIAEDEVCKYMLEENALVINRVNSPSHLGKSLVVRPRHLPAVFESNMMGMSLSVEVEARYVHYWLSSVNGKKELTRNAKWAVNQASINQGDVSGTPVPLPPAVEQRRIVEEIERLLSAVEENSSIVEANLVRCARLRQSLLKWAFEGKLADQDPTDEPASALLERIRQERAAAEQSPSRKAPRNPGRPKKS